MRRHNKATVSVLFLLFFYALAAGSVFAQSQNQQSSGQQHQTVQATPLPSDIDPSDPALPVWLKPSTAASSSKGSTAGNAQIAANEDIVPTGQSRVGQVTKGDKGFLMKAVVENVTLPVTVVDDRKHVVTGLRQSDFTIYENGEPQQIIDFRREDIPVSIGILVDNSGSMREKRPKVAAAVLNLIKASNPSDEEFIVNFADEAYIDQDFTNNLNLLHEALDRLDSRGSTALYDAVIASCDHLAKAAKLDKKVLIVVTDGEDNTSQESLEQAIRAVQNEKGPTIYTIGILGHEGKQRRAERALRELSMETGGVAFFPKDLDEVDSISQAVAKDIRNQYSLTYKPSNPQTNGGYRQVKVVVRASGYKELEARTKSGYFAGQQKNTASNKPGGQ